MSYETDQSQATPAPQPPTPSRGLFSDIWNFVARKPRVPTLIEFVNEEQRKEYSLRIMQRLGIDVSKYAILNVHSIGIDVPTAFVFQELLNWDGNSICWPNHIAQVERMSGQLEHIQIYLLGKRKSVFGLKNGFLGLKFIPLFELDAIKFQSVPESSDFDNARYLLYDCGGGYPIGIFTMYVRSFVADRGELEQAQLFMAVGFDFYGRKDLPKRHLIGKAWERIHNRVTANILNRFKEMCEAKFHAFREGDPATTTDRKAAGV
jgi:hypothetical protein